MEEIEKNKILLQNFIRNRHIYLKCHQLNSKILLNFESRVGLIRLTCVEKKKK